MEHRANNPFTLDFGREPYEMIPRSIQTDELIQSLLQEYPSSHVTIITGVRGSGKTVFMTSICKRIRDEKNWVVVELNPDRDLLQSFASRLSENRGIRDIFKSAKINLSALGLGLQIEGSEPIMDIEVALTRMLSSLKKHHKKVLISIDEATVTPGMKVFASTFQILLRQDLPVFLLMTGLYENIRNLQDQKSLTFLYRAPRIALNPLNVGRMTDSYARIFAIDQSKALEMAKKTKGYSFAFQVLGYFTWKYRDDSSRINAEYKQYLDEYVYDKIWSELSETDRRVLFAIAESESGDVADVRERLHMSSNQFSPYRARLIRKGIINGSIHGNVRFELPLFDDFVVENYDL